MTFKKYILMREGGFISDDKAEEGKSRPRKPQIRGPSSVTLSGISGGPGGAGGAGGAGPAPGGNVPAPRGAAVK